MSDIFSGLKVFYCYSHKDIDLRDKLDIHLTSLKRMGIEHWYDQEVEAGELREKRILKEIVTI